MADQKYINTSYFNEDTFQDDPVNEKIIQQLHQYHFNDTKPVSFKDVKPNSDAFEAWAYDHHIPGNHAAKRVAKQYLDLYVALLTQQKPAKPKSMREHLVDDTHVASATINQLKSFDLMDQIKVVNYQDVVGGINHFQPWLKTHQIPFDAKHHRVQQRYLSLYETLLKQVRDRKKRDLQKQKQQQIAASKAAVAQSIAASQASASAFEASMAKKVSLAQQQSMQASLKASEAALGKSIHDSIAAQKKATRPQSVTPISSASHTMDATDDDLDELDSLANLAQGEVGLNASLKAALDEDRSLAAQSKAQQVQKHQNELPFQIADHPVNNQPTDDDDDQEFDDMLAGSLPNQAASASQAPTKKPIVNQGFTVPKSSTFQPKNADLDDDDDAEFTVSDAIDDQSSMADQSISHSFVNSNPVSDFRGMPNPRNRYLSDRKMFQTLPKDIPEAHQYGPIIIDRKLKDKVRRPSQLEPDVTESRLYVDNNMMDSLRAGLSQLLDDRFATIMLYDSHRARGNNQKGNTYSISNTDVLASYSMYMQTASGNFTEKTWQQWCAGKVLEQVVAKTGRDHHHVKDDPYRKLIAYDDINEAIYNDNTDPKDKRHAVKLPQLMRWYLYLSQRKPHVFFNERMDNASLGKKIDQLSYDVDVSQQLGTILLSLQDEDQWQELLLGDRSKKLANMINEFRQELIKPTKTRRRTSITQHQNRKRYSKKDDQ